MRGPSSDAHTHPKTSPEGVSMRMSIRVSRRNLSLSAPGGFDVAASRHPELARYAGSDSGAPPQTPQHQTLPGRTNSDFAGKLG